MSPRPAQTSRELLHVGVFSTGNAGDGVLPVVLRDLFDQEAGASVWRQQPVRSAVHDTVIDRANHGDGLVIGGGGLFLRDSNANDVSGWQWAVSVDQIERVRVPIVVFAVGYNRFRGQDDFGDRFADNVTALLRRSAFFGLRNHGSIEAIKEYVPAELHDRIRFQPCMTTVIKKVYPELPAPDAERFIALNCAFDRSDLRYGSDKQAILDRLVEAARILASEIPIRYYAHGESDVEFSRLLESRGVPHTLVRLHNRPPAEVVDAWARATLAIGMRGHAQMIPFGCGTPILTLASHDKMRWFLQDIGHDEWGVEVSDPNSTDRIVALARDILAREKEVRNQISEAMDRLWDITTENLQIIGGALGRTDGRLAATQRR